MATERYGVYKYDPTNMYREPIRTYKRKHSAEAYAEKLTAECALSHTFGGFVVRRDYAAERDEALAAALALSRGDAP
jgi:hypothetical protein